MKKFLALLGLALLPCATSPAQSQGYFGTSHEPRPPGSPPAATPAATGTPSVSVPAPVPTPRSRILTEDDFRAFLVDTTWQWRGPGLNRPYALTFYADGTARNTGGWVARFAIKNITEVELRLNGGEFAKMTFDRTYTSYDGIDFDKKRPLHGQREK